MRSISLFALLVLTAFIAWGQEEEPAPEAPQAPPPEETRQDAPQDAPPQESAQFASPEERGRYLVHHVAMCVVCHTPKTSDGKLITGQLLRGAPMPVESPYPRQPWAFRAPAIAGLGGFSEEDLVTLLQTGSRPDGATPQPPMPPYRMTEQDARAVAAYLKSLR